MDSVLAKGLCLLLPVCSVFDQSSLRRSQCAKQSIAILQLISSSCSEISFEQHQSCCLTLIAFLPSRKLDRQNAFLQQKPTVQLILAFASRQRLESTHSQQRLQRESSHFVLRPSPHLYNVSTMTHPSPCYSIGILQTAKTQSSCDIILQVRTRGPDTPKQC